MVEITITTLGLCLLGVLYLLVGAIVAYKMVIEHCMQALIVIYFWPIFVAVSFVKKLRRKGY